MPGFPELLFILIILAIVFGARWLPQLGAAIGRLLARDKPTVGLDKSQAPEKKRA